MNSAVEAQKNHLREHLLTARKAAGALDEASAAVSRRLLNLPELAGVHTLLGYAATAHEVAIDAALTDLLERGVTVCLPWVDGASLGVAPVASLDDLEPGWRGVREPAPSNRHSLRPTALQAVFVPGLGFDRAGNRLGYGGGHFDRLLAQVRRGTVVVGVALDEQIVAAIPVAGHDHAVDVVVTPTATIRPPA